MSLALVGGAGERRYDREVERQRAARRRAADRVPWSPEEVAALDRLLAEGKSPAWIARTGQLPGRTRRQVYNKVQDKGYREERRGQQGLGLMLGTGPRPSQAAIDARDARLAAEADQGVMEDLSVRLLGDPGPIRRVAILEAAIKDDRLRMENGMLSVSAVKAPDERRDTGYARPFRWG